MQQNYKKILVFLICLNLANLFAQTTIVLTPIDSKTLCNGCATNWNDNRHRHYQSSTAGGWKASGFLKFDLSSIPNASVITALSLRTFHELGFSNPYQLPEAEYWRCNTDTWASTNPADVWPGLAQLLHPSISGPFPSTNLTPWDWPLDYTVIPWATDLADDRLTLVAQNPKPTYSYVYWYGHLASPAPPQLTISYIPAVLPINLLNFQASILSKTDNTVELKWNVEKPFDGEFIVEYSKNTTDWDKIASQNATQELNYSSTHNPNSNGIHFYRLQFTDKQGNTNYSETKEVTFETPNEIKVYPTVLNRGEKTVIECTLNEGETLTATIYDAMGKLLYGNIQAYQSGHNRIELPTFTLSEGIYLIQTDSKNQRQSFKIMIH